VLGGVHRWVLIECSSAFCPLPVARVIADGGGDVSVCPALTCSGRLDRDRAVLLVLLVLVVPVVPGGPVTYPS
jgi:hypothetical protein